MRIYRDKKKQFIMAACKSISAFKNVDNQNNDDEEREKSEREKDDNVKKKKDSDF